MNGWRIRVRDMMRNWGASETITFALGLSLALFFIVGMILLGAPAAQDAIDNSPSIPEELADHQERAGLERGRSVGATPSKALPRPDTIFKDFQFVESPNWSGRGTCGIEAIVLHVTGPGSLAGMDSWFKNPSSSVSAHFGIGKKGEVHQYVEVGDSSWNAGILNRPDLTNPLIQNWVTQNINPNRCIVGIELLLGGPAEPLADHPDMQASLDRLLTWLRDTTGVPLDRVHVIGHYQIDAVNRSTDPRCCADIDAILKGLGAQPAAQLFVFPDGWGYEAKSGDWYNPQGQKEWSACNTDSLRWNYTVNAWFPPGAAFYLPSRGYWALAGQC